MGATRAFLPNSKSFYQNQNHDFGKKILILVKKDFDFGKKDFDFGKKDFDFGKKDFDFGKKDFDFGKKDFDFGKKILILILVKTGCCRGQQNGRPALTHKTAPGMHWKGGGGTPPPFHGAQPMPSHCLLDAKCQPQGYV